MRTTGDDRRPDDEHDEIKYRPYLFCRISKDDDGVRPPRGGPYHGMHWDMGIKSNPQHLVVHVRPGTPQVPIIKIKNASPIPAEFCVVSFSFAGLGPDILHLLRDWVFHKTSVCLEMVQWRWRVPVGFRKLDGVIDSMALSMIPSVTLTR
jgi:hypothetical protein